MKVLVAGASGTLGAPLLRALQAAGHSVVGIARTQQGAQIVRERGAEVLVADVLDREALLRAVSGVRCDAVLHELTALEKNPTRFADMRKTNDLRTAGSTHLIEAAHATGASRFITQSIIFGYGYSDVGAVDETDAFGQLAGDATDEAVRAMSSAEEQAFSATGLDGIALRYGLFYGADAAHMAQMLNRGSLPVPRHWAGTLSFVHHEDAAVATVAALEHGAAGRAYTSWTINQRAGASTSRRSLRPTAPVAPSYCPTGHSAW